MGSSESAWVKQRVKELALALDRIQANLIPHRPNREFERERLLDELQDEVAALKTENRKLRRQLNKLRRNANPKE